jgi:DNA-binding NarL/FixJ family response regulator
MARGQAVLCQRSEKAIVQTLWVAGSVEATRKLTPRQQDAMSGLLRGLINKEIASEQGVTEGTVDSQLGEIFRKLEVHSRAEAVKVLRVVSDPLEPVNQFMAALFPTRRTTGR